MIRAHARGPDDGGTPKLGVGVVAPCFRSLPADPPA